MDSQRDPDCEAPGGCCPPGFICRRCYPGLSAYIPNLIEIAIDVVNMYDQANTNGAISTMGTRAALLHEQITALRDLLNTGKWRTIL